MTVKKKSLFDHVNQVTSVQNPNYWDEISDEDKEHDFFLQQLNNTIGQLKELQKKGGMGPDKKNISGPAGAIVTPAGLDETSIESSRANFTTTSSLTK